MVRGILFGLFVYLFPLSIFALADVSVNASLDTTTLNQGWPIKGTLEITHDANQKVDEESALIGGKPLKIHLLRNVRISPESPVTVSIYQFSLPSQNKGSYLLPSLSIKVGGKTYQTLSIPYDVQGPIAIPTTPSAGSQGPQADSLKLEAFIEGPSELYPGQSTKLVYRYTYEGNIALSKETLPMLEAEGLQKVGRYEINNYTQGNASIFEISQKVQALKPGKFSWGPSIIEGIVYVEDALGNKQFTTTQLHSEAPPVSLTVDPFPNEGKPASFNGAFGDFVIHVDLKSPDKVSVGDPISLNVVVSGKTSNWDAVTLPELCCQPGFGGFFKMADLPPIGKMEGESKHFTVEINPLSSAIRSIPAIQFSFFQPEKGKYKVVYSTPLAISVSPIQDISQQKIASSEESYATSEKAADWLKTYRQFSPLNHQHLITLEKADLRNKFFGSWWILWLIPLSGLLLILQINLKKHLEERKARVKLKTSRDIYDDMLKAPHSSSLFFELLKKCLLLRLEERGEIPSKNMNIDRIPTEGNAGKVRTFLKGVDSVRYTGKTVDETFYKKILDDGKKLFKELE